MARQMKTQLQSADGCTFNVAPRRWATWAMRSALAAAVLVALGAAGWSLLEGSRPVVGDESSLETLVDFSATSILSDFESERAIEALLRHLCANPEWFVKWSKEIGPNKKVRQIIEATRSAKRPPTSEPTFESGYHQAGVGIRFDVLPLGGSANEMHAAVKPGAGKVKLPLTPAIDSSRRLNSLATIEGGKLTVSIYESSVERDRALTRQAVLELCAELTAVRDNIAEIEEKGYCSKSLPPGSVRRSTTDLPLEIRDEFHEGMYVVSGYVNPGEKGYISLRVFHVPSGEELDGDVHSWSTVQYVGWSRRPEDKFPFCIDLQAPSYLTPEESKLEFDDPRRMEALAAKHEMRVEVWFHGKQSRKVLEAKKVLVPWMR